MGRIIGYRLDCWACAVGRHDVCTRGRCQCYQEAPLLHQLDSTKRGSRRVLGVFAKLIRWIKG